MLSPKRVKRRKQFRGTMAGNMMNLRQATRIKPIEREIMY